MLLPKIFPIIDETDDDNNLEVLFDTDGDVMEIKYQGHGYGYPETARVNEQFRFDQPAVGFPYSRTEWETTEHFRKGEGRRPTPQTQDTVSEEKSTSPKVPKPEPCRSPIDEEEQARRIKAGEEIAQRRNFVNSFRRCIGGRETTTESLLLKVTYERILVEDLTRDVAPEFMGQHVWGFVDPRSFPYLRREGPEQSLSDLIRLPPDKHDKLRDYCREGDLCLKRDVWGVVSIDGLEWRYDFHLEFRQFEDRHEGLSDFYVVEQIGLLTF